MSRLSQLSPADFRARVADVDSELSALIGARRDAPPNVSRSTAIAELTAERRLYVRHIAGNVARELASADPGAPRAARVWSELLDDVR